MKRRRLLLLMLMTAVASTTTAARADWLALKSGVRIETKGRWAVTDRMVAYYDLAGKVQVINRMTVDYPQTVELNLAAAEGRPLPPPPPPRPKIVIDDTKVKRVIPVEVAPFDYELLIHDLYDGCEKRYTEEPAAREICKLRVDRFVGL